MTPEEIKVLRQSLDLTQERFAALIETTAHTVNRWENGKRKPSRLFVREMIRIREELIKGWSLQDE